MVNVVEVKTHKQKRLFATYPLKLFKGCPYYVPSLRSDEMNTMNPKKNFSLAYCSVKCFLAYKDGKLVGRIAGIIQRKYNEISGRKCIRFSRFDCIDDFEVAKALIGAVEKMGKENGMDTLHGPWGFNDTDREGLLTYGYDKRSTYATNYSYPYMKDLVEKTGFSEEAHWVENRIKIPDKPFEKSARVAQLAKKRLNVRDVTETMSVKQIVKKYGDEWFKTYNEAYSKLDGFVPVEGKEKKNVLKQFATIINRDFFSCIVDENEEVAAFGVVLSDICPALIKHKGKLFPIGFFDFLRAIKRPEGVEMALVGVKHKYKNSGINAIIINKIAESLIRYKIPYIETNPTLVTNDNIQLQWKFMETEIIKERKTYVKHI